MADRSPSATTVAYLTDYPATLSYGGKTYRPFPFAISDIQNDSEGTLPQVDLTLSNVTRVWGRYLEIGNGFRGQSVILYRFTRADLTTPWSTETYTIKSASLTAESVQFRLEMPSMADYQVPADQFLRNSCRWRYGSDECGFALVAGLPAEFTTCDKSLTACEARGDYEVSQGRARLHPRRYGSFPTMPNGVRG